jgi:hypothetical protein
LISDKEGFVDVAPAPVLTRFERLHDGVLGLVKVLGRVLVLGRITAADVATDQALPQMDPGVSHLQAFLAAFAAGLYVVNLFHMRASGSSLRHRDLLRE